MDAFPPMVSPRFQVAGGVLQYKPYPSYPSWLDAWDVGALVPSDVQAQIDAIVADVITLQTDVVTAQTTANTAITNAATALAAANEADDTADAAQATANTALANAATAQTTANTAITNAATALAAANEADDTADAAQTTANTAITNAATALAAANEADDTADAAQTTANTAITNAATALAAANEADDTADTAQARADAAYTLAAAANPTADLPDCVLLLPSNFRTITVGFGDPTLDARQHMSMYFPFVGLNTKAECKILLQAATYTLQLSFLSAATGGDLAVKVDGTTTNTVNMYTAGANQFSRLINMSLGALSAGLHTITLEITGHHSPSTGYDCYCAFIAIRRST